APVPCSRPAHLRRSRAGRLGRRVHVRPRRRHPGGRRADGGRAAAAPGVAWAGGPRVAARARPRGGRRGRRGAAGTGGRRLRAADPHRDRRAAGARRPAPGRRRR
ncbi:MAG: hypothetical protein AVDCRST_MAG36-1719, partial [uncultured Nocardioidaceae bacterium]